MLNIVLQAALAGGLFHATVPLLAQPVPTALPNATALPVDAPLAPPPPAPASYALPALFPVELTVVDEISSGISRTGDVVKLRLASPLYVTADLGLPEGMVVEGMVIHAAKGGMGGKSGELLIAAQRIVLDDQVAIALRSFEVAPARGRNNQGVAMGVAVAGGAIGGVASLFITGGSARVAAGTRALAKTRTATELPASLLVKLSPRILVTIPPSPAPAIITKGK